MIQQWAENLNKETKSFWESKGSPKEGFATFYSPVTEKPKFVIIGYNLGGGEKDFIGTVQLPVDHDYFAHKKGYKLATNMKAIFSEAGLEDQLRQSVKTNLVFFRSKKASDIRDKEVISFSGKKVAEMIEILKPEYIVAEGFGTFDALINLVGGKKDRDLRSSGPKSICLASIGCTKDGVPVIGFRHPSGSRPNLSEALLKEMGRILQQFTFHKGENSGAPSQTQAHS